MCGVSNAFQTEKLVVKIKKNYMYLNKFFNFSALLGEQRTENVNFT